MTITFKGVLIIYRFGVICHHEITAQAACRQAAVQAIFDAKCLADPCDAFDLHELRQVPS